MKPAFTFEEIREVEKKIIELDRVSSLLLMENAGKNSFDVIKEEVKDLDEREIFIVCGKGNNAGDGLAAARHFAVNGNDVKVIMLENQNDLKGDALINFELLSSFSSQRIQFVDFEFLVNFFKKLNKGSKVLIVDAILGTGVKGLIYNEKLLTAIRFLNDVKKKFRNLLIVSLDIPSGLILGEQVNPIAEADLTITMGSIKVELLYGYGKENSGKIRTVPIGIEEELIEKYNVYGKHIVEIADVKAMFPRRKKRSHKYTNGKVLVVGGSKGLSGAVAMSSLSALKSGAGGVTVGVPKSIVKTFNQKFYEIMKAELDEDENGTISSNSFGKIKKRVEWADVVLIGPGMSTSESSKEFFFDFIKRCSKNIVIDADGLNLLSDDITVLKNRNFDNEIILTPHLGEFSRLHKTDIKSIELSRFELVRGFVKEYNVNLSLKSETTISCTNDGDIFINSSGNESLATAGSGDVLSGMISSIFSQTGNPKAAMICGNYLHGLCADMYYDSYGNKQTASPQDFIKLIPGAITKILI